MTLAQSIREAALTWPMPPSGHVEAAIITWGFCGIFEPLREASDDVERIYMLFVACALEG